MISLHARWKLVIGMLVAVLLPSLAHAQHDVRGWPDPGWVNLVEPAIGPRTRWGIGGLGGTDLGQLAPQLLPFCWLIWRARNSTSLRTIG